MLRQQTASRFTEQEMDIAKGTDLPDLLTHLGYQVRRVGSYEQALNIISEYVETELTPPPTQQRSNKKKETRDAHER